MYQDDRQRKKLKRQNIEPKCVSVKIIFPRFYKKWRFVKTRLSLLFYKRTTVSSIIFCQPPIFPINFATFLTHFFWKHNLDLYVVAGYRACSTYKHCSQKSVPKLPLLEPILRHLNLLCNCVMLLRKFEFHFLSFPSTWVLCNNSIM
jgi:hypothetical protein